MATEKLILKNGWVVTGDDAGVSWPRADLVMQNTDPAREVQEPMFRRIYDSTVEQLFDADADGQWWCIDVRRNADRVVPLTKRVETHATPPTICICHD